MPLLPRTCSPARAQARSLRARLAGAARMLVQRLRRQPELPACLIEVSATLDDLAPLHGKIALQRKEILQREATALEAILQKTTPFVPLLDDSEPYYRKSITIFTKSESVPLDDDRSFGSDLRLLLYEDGRLTRARRFRETCTSGFGWEQEEEEELDCATAVSLCGLEAIASGLAATLDKPAVEKMNADLKERLSAMAKILEALQRLP